MQLQLGEFAFDVTTRGLVVASISAAEVAGPGMDALAAERPALIEITGAAADTVDAAIGYVADIFPGPLSVLTSDAHVAGSALAAGANVVHDPTGLTDPSYLYTVEEAGGSVMISCPSGVAAPMAFLIERARWAHAAGIATERVVLHAPAQAVDALSAGGYRVLVTSPDDPSAQGFNTMMISRGARLVASNQVRSTRRTIDTVSELIERREPELLEPAGVT